MVKEVLEGVRVISMGSAWAGPYAGRVLGELGAEVFRISYFGGGAREGAGKLVEAWKSSLIGKGMSAEEAERATKMVPGFPALYQCSNYGVGLDLRSTKGKEIYKKLVKVTDIVIDGWSPRVMTNLGLDYSVLKGVKPDIIYVSVPALGMTGPQKDVRMWGSGCEALSGMDSIRGYADGVPYPSLGYIGDPISAMHIVVAILVALNYRFETGKGQHIDISQTEVVTCTMGEAIMDYSMNKRVATPQGNRHPYYAPHGCYRCKGADMWVTIAVTSEEEWCCFCNAIGYPEWTKDPKFADMLSRWKNQDELDKLIEEWTIKHEHYAIQEILQKAGVPAAAVVNLEEHIFYDPQVKDRNVYHWIIYHDGIADPVFRVPWILPKSPANIKWCGPYVGQHNDYVFGKVLGMPKRKIAQLTKEKVIGVTLPVT